MNEFARNLPWAEEDSGGLSVRPIKRAAMQVHHRRNVQNVRLHAVNDRVGKPVKVELAILPSKQVPALRISYDAAQGSFKLVQEIIPQSGLLFLVPQRSRCQLLLRFRMTDDAHGAGCGHP
jgi:hypothetical protein